VNDDDEKEWMHRRECTFHTMVTFLETVQASESSDASATARIPVGWPDTSSAGTFSAVTTSLG
jgi:hypothetical protein